MPASKIRADIRAWNKSFDLYVQLRKKDRKELIVQKAARFAYEAYKFLPATGAARIRAELFQNKLLLKLAVISLQKKNVSLIGTAADVAEAPRRRRSKKKRALTPGNLLVKAEANRILGSRRASSGYHRLAFLILSQQLRGVSITSVGSRLLKQTKATIRDGSKTSVFLSAVARGLDCPSTQAAKEKALASVQSDMQQYIDDHLSKTKAKAGFKR